MRVVDGGTTRAPAAGKERVRSTREFRLWWASQEPRRRERPYWQPVAAALSHAYGPRQRAALRPPSL